MNQKMKYIGLFAILPLVMIALSPEFVDIVHAQKSEGSPSQISPKSYGSATSDVVCGASLCSTPVGSPDPINEGKPQ